MRNNEKRRSTRTHDDNGEGRIAANAPKTKTITTQPLQS